MATRRSVWWHLGFGVLALPALTLRAGSAQEQPAGPWRVISTSHFRVHYLVPAEGWAQRAASRLESVRERVIAEVGFAPPETVDVVVEDPIADANGAAYPILGWPRLVLWTSPPEADSELGVYRDYTELLLVHETAHLAHLLRPSRNPAERLLERLVPVGPIGLRVPRWVVEGYATLIEGRLTAAGRPNSDLRASILRRWAAGGRLPTYGQLASDSRSYEGMSMAYLMGSAYLEWLELRGGPGSLKKLWARLSARTRRTFDEAFDGVFDGSPNVLYGRFCAELTWRALEAERRVNGAGTLVAREGELFQSLDWSTGAPAISPDGQRLVVAVRSRTLPTELVVWSTAVDTKNVERVKSRSDEAQREDPDDVIAPGRRAPHRVLFSLPSRDGISPRMPRWMPNNREILFVRFEPDARGVLHPDVFLWDTESGATRRLTHEADLRDPDPSPDGHSAVAVRDRNGTSQLVMVDLSSGAVRELTPPSLDAIFDRPRISPDGHSLAVARSQDGSWRLRVYAFVCGGEIDAGRELEAPAAANVVSPAWFPDSRSLTAAVGLDGFIDAWWFSASPGDSSERVPTMAAHPLTRTMGAAFAPAPAPDGRAVYFLALKPEGLDLRRIELSGGPLLPQGSVPVALAPAVRPGSPPAVPPFALGTIGPSRPEGVGRAEWLPILGGTTTTAGAAAELGARAGDLLGRLDLLLLGALSADGLDHGGAVTAAWRGWPVEVSLHLFDVETDPAHQAGALSVSGDLGLRRSGGELGARWARIGDGTRLDLVGRLLKEHLEVSESSKPPAGGGLSRTSGSLGGEATVRRRFGIWRVNAVADGRFEVGETAGSSWQRWRSGFELEARTKSSGLAVSWRRDGSSRRTQTVDLFALGGVESSLLPDSVLNGRIVDPALPLGFALGGEHEEQRLELTLPGLPVPLFYERHRLWDGPMGSLPWFDLVGIEPTFAVSPVPLLRLPAFSLRAGFARLLAGRLGESNRWWLTTVWRP